MKIAIFGAAGAIGRTMTPELLRRGHQVRLVGRNRARLEPLAAGGAEIVEADLADPAGARRAAAGVDAVLYAVGLPYPQSAQYPPLMRLALEAAGAAGVRQFLLISTVYPYGRAQTPLVGENHPREPHTVKGANRKLQADLVLAADDPAGLRTAVLVLPDFYGPDVDLSYAKSIIDAALTGKTATVVGPLDVPHEYVYLPDAAPVIAELFDRPAAFGRTYHLAGAGTITSRAFIAAAERAGGKRIGVLSANKTLLRLLGTFDPFMREIVEMYYLFSEPVVLDDTALRTLLGELPKTPYETGIAQTIGILRARAQTPEIAHV